MRRTVCLVLAVALMLGFAAGCRTGETVTVWLLAPEGSGSGVRSVEAPVPEGEDAGLAAMHALIDPPDSAAASGLESPFAEGVECVGVEYAGGTAIVRLSEEYLEMSGCELSEAEGCAALTMLEIPRVSSVRILVNGSPHPEGAQDVLSASDIARRIDEDWAESTIYRFIKSLIAKKAVNIADYTQMGKVYGRLFSPAVSSEEYSVGQFSLYYVKENELPHILYSLVDNVSKGKFQLIDKTRELIEGFS